MQDGYRHPRGLHLGRGKFHTTNGTKRMYIAVGVKYLLKSLAKG